MKNLFKKFSSKIVVCPSCQRRSRVPLRPNKTLEISCPGCQNPFRIQFKSPILDFFTWYKGQGLTYNIKSFWYRYKLLPFGRRLQIFIVIFFLIYTLVGMFSMTSRTVPSDQKPIKKVSPYAIEV